VKVHINLSMDIDVRNAPKSTCQAVEFSMAQFLEQLEASIEGKLLEQFPDVELSFGAVEEGR
jgi:hypothetical protein